MTTTATTKAGTAERAAAMREVLRRRREAAEAEVYQATTTGAVRITATYDRDDAAADPWAQYRVEVAVGSPLEVAVCYMWMEYLTRNGRVRPARDGAYLVPAEGWRWPDVTEQGTRRPVDWRGGPATRDLALHLRRAPAKPSGDGDEATGEIDE